MVVDNLRVGLSPDQIAGTLKLMALALDPVNSRMWPSIRPSTPCHDKRRPRARGHDRRGQIPNMVPVSQRPTEIEERLIPGHWEGDAIKGKYNRSAVGTLHAVHRVG
jgi:IS30 family transposase